jgi:hypothetical protein
VVLNLLDWLPSLVESCKASLESLFSFEKSAQGALSARPPTLLGGNTFPPR